MTDVFISYSRDDAAFGRDIHTALTKTGRDVWMDWTSIPLTAEWWKEITDGIENSDNFLFLISPSSVASPVCNLEVAYARSLNKRIIPVLVRTTDEKQSHVELVHKELSDYQTFLLAGRDLLVIARDNWKEIAAPRNWVNFTSKGTFEEHLISLDTALDTDLEYVHEHTRLLTRANDWDKRSRLPSLLLQGDDLKVAEDWLVTALDKKPATLPLHHEFIAASRRAEYKRLAQVAEEKRRLEDLQAQTKALELQNQASILESEQLGKRSRQFRLAAAVLAIVAIAAALLGGISLNSRQEAINAQNTSVAQVATATNQVATAGALLTSVPPTLDAVATRVQEGENRIESHRLAAVASDLMSQSSGNSSLATLLSIRALKSTFTAPAYSALRQATDHLNFLSGFIGHTYSVVGALELKDSRLLSWSNDGTLRLWGSDGTTIATLTGHTRRVEGALELKDGRLLSWSNDRTLRLWGSDGTAIATLSGHTSIIEGALELKDGRLLSWSNDGTLRLWGSDGTAIATLSGHTDKVLGALELKDGQLLSWSRDNTLRLWGSDGTEIVTLSGHEGEVDGVLELKDGRLLSWSQDQTLRLWANDGSAIAMLTGHRGIVFGALELKDGRLLSWGGLDAPVVGE